MNLDKLFNVDDPEVGRERLRQAIGEIREDMAASEKDYVIACTKLNDPDWMRDAIDVTFRSVFESLKAFDPVADPPAAAVYRLGQAVPTMDSVFAQIEVVRQYESALERLKDLKNTIDRWQTDAA